MKKRMDIFGVIGDKTLEDEWCCCYLSICWCPNLLLNVFFLHLKRCFCPCIYHGNKLDITQLPFTKAWIFSKNVNYTQVEEMDFVNLRKQLISEIQKEWNFK